jgi:formylglycine-generating enzyme required for sulfatase activity
MSSLLADIEQLWSSAAAPPDLTSWWSSISPAAGTGQIPAGDLLAALLLDQAHRWKTGGHWLVEDYLTRLPQLPPGVNWRLELAAGEFTARMACSQPANIEELTSRFPDIADTLRARLIPAPDEADTLRSRLIPAPDEADTLTEVVSLSIELLNSRYRPDRQLGEGKFGRVFIAWDEELQRDVALKIPAEQRFHDPVHAEEYLREARTLAGLEHPHILPVYDVGRTGDGGIFVVSRFVAGGTLSQLLRRQLPAPADSVRLLIPIAEALAFAHARRIIHRDVKPDNILVEEATGSPFLADFGLAIREDDFRRRPELAGTPAYMSPEQVRGEGHRLDGRSDLFSLGVVFYEMLTGSRPFQGPGRERVFHEITSIDPRPPRMLRNDVPEELERICLKALAKRASDRYPTTLAFAEELKEWLRPKPAATLPAGPTAVKPKGLRSFDADDADFFLELLPGLRNLHGLPESIVFWKQRIEQPDAGNAVSVGCIYGPSGCGKSSLVKAGLLPRLAKEITSIYLEATPGGTEERLCKALRKHRPELPADAGLTELLTTIRRNPGPKVAIFLDQFEQWLQWNAATAESELAQALRQCDGQRLQAVLLVRDDFWMPLTRFLAFLDVPLLQDVNSQHVDLFDPQHARRVLRLFGVAWGRLPEAESDQSPAQTAFLDQAVKGLSDEGQVICIRLALFARMFKSRDWSPDELQGIGGTAGVGRAFLEETFSGRHARPEHVRHRHAAVQILQALIIPDETRTTAHNSIKGVPRTAMELQAIAGYAGRDADFEDLLRILDSDLRLITPADGQSAADQPTTVHYQLTHDYLVPSIREWLRLNQTPAELLLEERSWRWADKRENRQLPSFAEWLRIGLQTNRSSWTGLQRTMMRKAAKVHLFRSCIASLLLVATLLMGAWMRKQSNAERARAFAVGVALQKTSELAAGLVPLKSLKHYALPTLKKLYDDADPLSDSHLHLAIARLQLEDPDAELLPTALQATLQCRPEQLLPLTELLQPWSAQLQPELRAVLQNNSESATRRLHAACLLGTWEAAGGRAESGSWSNPETADFVAAQLAEHNPVFVDSYQEVFRPQAQQLSKPLAKLFSNPETGDVPRSIATALLASFAADDAQLLAQLILDADPSSDKVLFPLLRSHREQAIQHLEAVLAQKLSPAWPDQPLNPAWQEPAPAVRARFEVAHGLIDERFAFCLDMPLPELISLSETLRSSGYRPTRLRPHAGPAAETPRMSAVWVRDGRNWAIHPALKQEDLPKPDVNAVRDALLLADVALVPGNGPQAGWLTLWSEPVVPNEERRCVVALAEAELNATIRQLSSQKFSSQLTLHIHHESSEPRLCTGIFSNVGPASDSLLAWTGFARIDSPQRDISAAVPEALPTDQPFAGLWFADPLLESQLVRGSSQAEVLQQTKSLLAESWRPTGVVVLPQESSQFVVLLHRPLIADQDRTALAAHQAAAATALLRLDAADRVWSLLQDSPDPTVRSLIQHRLPRYGVDPGLLITKLSDEQDVGRRRALILGVGELAKAGRIPPTNVDKLTTDLAARFAEDPDPGVHSAAEWALRQLGAVQRIAEIRAAFATGQAVGDRRWYVTRTTGDTANSSGLSMAIVDARDEFSMGSPLHESGRNAGIESTINLERRHRRRIGRVFAIGMHEVTVAQFRAFRQQHTFNRGYSREDDAPANVLTWYDAAAWCNWLSQQEGIPEDQWCYTQDKDSPTELKRKPNHQQLLGYRLPTEAEWEFACRAGTVTPRYFGTAEQLLGDYAWFLENSNQTFMLPAGSLRPNAFGLFETYGNAMEWCQNLVELTPPGAEWLDDSQQTETEGLATAASSRILRGGSFVNAASSMRSANRGRNRPDIRGDNFGFRVSRTLTAPP